MLKDQRVQFAIIGVAVLFGVVMVIRSIFFSGDADPQAAVRARAAAAPEENRTAKLAVYDKSQAAEMREMLNPSQPEKQRAAAAQRLGQIQDRESIDQLLDMLDDPSPIVRGRAAAAVTKILGAHFGFHANGPAKERKRIAGYMRQAAEVMKKNPPKK